MLWQKRRKLTNFYKERFTATMNSIKSFLKASLNKPVSQESASWSGYKNNKFKTGRILNSKTNLLWFHKHVYENILVTSLDNFMIFKLCIAKFSKEFFNKKFSLFFYQRKEVYIYPTPSPLAGCDTRSVFKRFKTGLNWEFFFLLTVCLTHAKKSSLPYYILIAEGRTDGFMPFPKNLYKGKCLQFCLGFELELPIPFPLW